MIPAPDPSTREGSFFKSGLTLDNAFQPLDEVRAWLRARQQDPTYSVREIPLDQVEGWRFDPDSGDLFHESGKFFRIEGVRVETNFPGTPGRWDQPIINQPEVGILGIVSRLFAGTRHFLIQAKMEPGNINLVQLSPTVQATRSNFTRVHRGRSPRFLEFFRDPSVPLLIDQLQSEQGSRFLRKRNRNMIVDVDQEIDPSDEFRWLTLAELKQLLAQDEDLVNMDTRTVISCVPFIDHHFAYQAQDASRDELAARSWFGHRLDGFRLDLLVSLLARERCLHDLDRLISWFTHMKTIYSLSVEYLPLKEVEGWVHRSDRIEHATENYFSVIGVAVEAADREVASWTQPILKHQGLGLVGLVAQEFDGVLHFLVQAKVEPGILDIVEMAPTVSIFDVERRRQRPETVPFLEVFLEPPADRVRFDRIQSEEGGRFYHLRNRYMIVELPAGEKVEPPENFIWMTLGQMLGFVRYDNYFNIEARNLLACLGFLGAPGGPPG